MKFSRFFLIFIVFGLLFGSNIATAAQTGGLGIAVLPKMTEVLSGNQLQYTFKIVSTENFNDTVRVYLTAEGIPSESALDLSWFNWTGNTVDIPAQGSVEIHNILTVPGGTENGNKAFRVVVESSRKISAMDTGLVIIKRSGSIPDDPTPDNNSSSTSDHFVQAPEADPSSIVVGDSTLVTITTKINPVAELLPDSIHLERLDENGNVISDLGQLYDDGMNGGDSRPGDSIFTKQVNFNEPDEGEIRLRITVSYSASPSPVYSDILTLNVLSLPSEEEVNIVLSTNAEASSNFDTWSQEYGADTARQMVIDSLKANSNVAEVSLSRDGTTIDVVYDSGLEAAILTEEEGTDGMPDSNIGIVASSLYSNSGLATSGECNYINNKLNDETCVQSTILADGVYTLDSVKNLDDKGVIFIHTHGGITGGVVSIMTGERASTFFGIPTSHLIDWVLKRVVVVSADGKNYWAFKPSFITHYANSFPDSLVVISACHSLDGDTMANAFLNKGAAAYVGWSDTVMRSFAIGINQVLFDRLADNKTLQEAFNGWTLAQRTDTTHNAVYIFRGDGNIRLPHEVVTNGRFETGDLSGWTAGFTEGGDFPYYACPGGYAIVIGGNVKEGSYASRLGRWDQVYTGGLYGAPAPGSQPAGIEWIYQDVMVPSTSNPTLTFSYNVQTYDTANWDWFDMEIRAPNTGATLATVVSRDCKPGSDYGVYWNGGWKDASYDLSPWKGQMIRLWFGDRQDGWGDQTAVFIDNVSIPCS